MYRTCFLSFFSFLLCSNTLSADNALNINSIRVSKDYPASFVIDLYSNDVVSIKYSKISGKGNMDDLVVKVVDLNLQEPETLKEIDRSGRNFAAPYDGKYRIDFIYRGKGGIRLIRERFIELKISVDNDGYFDLEDGETREVLHATACVIDEGKDKAMQLGYFLTEGDRITIGCDDSKSAFLQLYIPQLGKNYSIGSSKTIEISKDSYYSFHFFLQEGESGSILNFKDLLKDADILFQDLIIYREKAISFDPIGSSGTFGDADASNVDEDEDEEEDVSLEQDFLDIEKMMENSNKGSAETTKMIAEMMMEMQKKQEEMLNKKNISTEVYATELEEDLLLEPELNFAKQDLNKQCIELNTFNSNYNLWFYWVGVGDEAAKAFEEHNEKISKSFRQPLMNAYAEYLYYKYSSDETVKTRSKPNFPEEADFPQYLKEDIEYAIVDYENKRKFENGQRFRKKNVSSKRAKSITADFGVCSKPDSTDEILYFCAKNNNKATAVNVHFRYFLIQYEQEEY